MNGKNFISLLTVCGLLLVTSQRGLAQQHRATRLGNPATRFADPLTSPEDLRTLLRSEKLRPDIQFILRKSGYKGAEADLLKAAATADILSLQIPTGTRLRAMSTRQNGKPVLLHDVLWAGKEPIDAYEFYFTSKGRIYRLVAPKACANFWVEDQGKELKPALALDCDAPGTVLTHRPAQVCVALRNKGDAIEPFTQVTLESPAGATLTAMTAGGQVVSNRLTWAVTNLAAGETRTFCGQFNQSDPGKLKFVSTAQGQVSGTVNCQCETRVKGVAGVPFEMVDAVDPIEVGTNETYHVSVLNQGFAPITNVKMSCTLPDGQEFVSALGSTPVSPAKQELTMEPVLTLGPRETAQWDVVVKATAAGDMHFVTTMRCDQIKSPLKKTESTHQY